MSQTSNRYTALSGDQPTSRQKTRRSAREIQHWLVTRLAELLEIEPSAIDITEPSKNYGLNSVAAVGMSGDLEEWLGCTLSPTVIYTYPTIEQLAKYLAGDEVHPSNLPIADIPVPQTVREPVAIVGLACRFPGGATTPAAFWKLLKQGKSAVTEIPSERWDSSAFYDPDPNVLGKMYIRYGCFLQDIDLFDAHLFEISAREALRMDPQQRILLEVAWEALENAGIAVSDLTGSQTGVFVGMMNNHDYAHLQVSQGDGTHINDPYFGLGSASSIAAGRLPYLFDLQGPTMTVDTACSSSLVAVHLACQSLRNKDCHLALVGGTSSILSPENVVNACKMGMLSADGRCKSFDAAADGFVMGEGCGMVVLKRLSDAQRDGDTIWAVIRGSAVNQDGRTNGITAPNQLSQEAVIRRALNDAGVDPLHVSYVEAHGSGTALGDPIEIEALSNVLGQGRATRQDLMVGSVKTNIGHLTGAAGMAGLIKTVLALQHKEIPAHLNLKELNPHIAWDKHSIVIPTSTTAWPTEHETRIAGISSFGWSGTNAHLIIEEAPDVTSVGTRLIASVGASSPTLASDVTPRPWHLLPLSAKTETALEQVTDNLISYLQNHAQASFSDLIYTLQTGRSRLNARRVLVCRDKEDALAALTSRDARRLLHSTRNSQKTDRHPVAFLFPGLGERYTSVVQELYQAEPIFRQTIDHCCTFLQDHFGLDLSKAIHEKNQESATAPYTNGSSAAQFSRLPGHDNAHRTSEDKTWDQYKQTEIAQPAVFVIEYALAQLLMQWGIRPQFMLGYSLGEYVAACISGVLSLEDALTLVTRRAQLIQMRPQGLMLAVMLSESEVAPYLNKEISLAAINAPNTCVLAGSPEAIGILEQQLRLREIAHRRVETSHAFHSHMLAPLQNALTRIVRGMTLHAPQIPYISNVTGTWITAEQATDPAYWAAHMCQTVRFADGVGHLLEESDAALLEVGPGQSLNSFVKQHPACTRERMQITFSTFNSGVSDYASLLTVLGKLWLAGIQVNWKGLYNHERRQCISLPNYPFERQRYWFEQKPRALLSSGNSLDNSTGKKIDPADWFYIPLWKQAIPPDSAQAEAALEQKRCWVVLADKEEVSTRLIQALQQHGQEVVVVHPGSRWLQVDEQRYQVRPDARSDYQALFQSLREQGKTPNHLLHLWTVKTHIAATGLQEQEEVLQYGFYSLLALTQAIGNAGLEQVAVSIVCSQMYEVLGYESLYPAKNCLSGICKVVSQEYPHTTCRIIDLDERELASSASDSWLRQLLHAIVAPAQDEMVVALRSRRSWVPSYEGLAIQAANARGRAEAGPYEAASVLRQQGVYLITGGLGGIGLAVAEHLARTVQAKLILLGRSGLPERSQWPRMLQQAAHESSATARQISKVLQFEELGSEVCVLQADVANEEQMRRAVQKATEQFGTIHGVFHAAGVAGAGLMQFKTGELAAKVLSPKVQGTLVLERVLAAQPLDFMALFSSITSMVGGPGQADYSAANAFMDAYASSASRTQRRVLAIDWSEWQWNAWEEGLAGYGEMATFLRENRQRFGLTFEEGIEALNRALSCPQARVIVSTQDFRQVLEMGKTFTVATIAQEQQRQRTTSTVKRPELETSYVAPRNELERKVAALWSQLLCIEQVGIHDNFFELGGNSLLGMELIAQAKKIFGVTDLPAYILYEAPSVSTMARHFDSVVGTRLIASASSGVEATGNTRARSERRRESLNQRARETRRAR